MRSRRNPNQGVTLVELLTTIAILGIIISAIMTALPGMYRLNASTSGEQSVTNHARVVMETTRAHWLVFVPATANSTDTYPNFTAGTLPTLPPAPAGYVCPTPTVTQVGTASPPSRRRLTVTCTATADARVTTFVAEFGRP